MGLEFASMDIEALKALYKEKLDNLNSKLLTGCEWEEVRELRNIVSKIGAAIDIKTETFNRPSTLREKSKA